MGIRNLVKSSFKAVFNYRKAGGVDNIKQSSSSLRDSLRKFFVPGTGQVKESFEGAKSRLSLSNKQIEERKREFLRLAYIMLSVTVGIFFYFIYHVVSGNGLSSVVSFVMIFLGAAVTFRYHFWYFQLCQGKLGCTFKEYFHYAILGKKQ